MLMRAGYTLDDRTGVWSRPGYGGIAHGDEAEQRVEAAIKTAGDLSILSEELRTHCVDWPSLYHLSALRANILRPFERHLRGAVLEIGACCGAITRCLGECGGDVLALEGSPRRAAIARSRTRDLPNVAVVAERFEDFQCEAKFDIVTLIGVLEHASLFLPGQTPAAGLLERARSFLRPGGLLVVAIENQLGLKYFAGAAEDHIGCAMYGIEDRYRDDEPRTFGRKVLDDLLIQAGYCSTSFLAPFPDYKLPTSIIAESGFLEPNFDAAALAWQSVPQDPQLPPLLAFAQELAWPAVARNGLALDLSNSFLVAACNGDDVIVDPADLAWHFSTTRRRKRFCKETRFVPRQDGLIETRYRSLASSDSRVQTDTSLVSFGVPEKSAYVYGQPLSQEIVEILSRDGWTLKEVDRFFRTYIHALETILEDSDHSEGGVQKVDAPDVQLPGFFFDIVPHNIIVAADETYHLIDREWDLATGVSAGFLVFRALLNIISVTKRVGHSNETFEATPLGLINAIMRAIGWPMTQEACLDMSSWNQPSSSTPRANRANSTICLAGQRRGCRYATT